MPLMHDPRHRDLLRRDRGRRRRGDRRRRASVARCARTSSRRRSRSTASGAASCRSSRRASTSATSAASSSARWPMPAIGWRDVDAIAVTQGPGLVGSLLVGVSFAKAAAWALRQAAGRRPSPGRPHRIDLARARRDPAAGGRARRVGRAHQPLSRADATASISCSAARATMRRARRTTRWRSCWGSGIRAGPIIDRLAAEGNDTRDPLAGHAADPSRSQRARARRPLRFQLQRPQDRGAAPRARSGRRRSASEQLPPAEIVDIAASFQRGVVETLVDRTFAAARWHGARASASPAACRRTAPAARGARARRERSEMPVYIPRLSLSTDNAAMIAAAGLRQLDRGSHCAGGSERLARRCRSEQASPVASAATPRYLDQHPLGSLAVELAVEDLLPGAEVELALGDRDDDLAAHDLALQVGVGVVLAGAVVRVALGRGVERRQLLEPLGVVAGAARARRR